MRHFSFSVQEIPDEEADNIATVQQAIDYVANSPEGKQKQHIICTWLWSWHPYFRLS